MDEKIQAMVDAAVAKARDEARVVSDAEWAATEPARDWLMDRLFANSMLAHHIYSIWDEFQDEHGEMTELFGDTVGMFASILVEPDDDESTDD